MCPAPRPHIRLTKNILLSKVAFRILRCLVSTRALKPYGYGHVEAPVLRLPLSAPTTAHITSPVQSQLITFIRVIYVFCVRHFVMHHPPFGTVIQKGALFQYVDTWAPHLERSCHKLFGTVVVWVQCTWNAWTIWFSVRLKLVLSWANNTMYVIMKPSVFVLYFGEL